MIQNSLYKNLPAYYQKYLDYVETNNLLAELESSKIITENIFKMIPKELENFSYKQNKWTIKEVLRHIIDCERIFSYRAFRFSRFDDTELSGFDEDHYIEKVRAYNLKLPELFEEFLAVRESTICMFKSMNNEMLNFEGKANDIVFSAGLIGFIAVGHNLHHCNVIKTRYLF